MRAILFRQAMLIGACALMVSSCAYPHPGPQFPADDDALPSSSEAAPAASVPSPSKPARKPDPGADAALPPEQGTSDDDMDASSGFDHVEIVDASLNGKLTILRIGSEQSPNNLLSVFAGLKNKTAHRLDLEMQTLYKDKDGNPLNDGGWIPMTLKPHGETEYRSASISAAAADFLVRVRIRHAPKSAVSAGGSQ